MDTQHSWIFHEIELSKTDSFSIKSWILTAMTLYPDNFQLKTNLFTHLIQNQPDLFRSEIDELFQEILSKPCPENEKFWTPLEDTLLDLKQLATPLSKYIWSLPSKKQHEILRTTIDRANQIQGNLKKSTKLALKLNDYDSTAFVDKLKELMEKLLASEKEMVSETMQSHLLQFPSSSQMVSLVNYSNGYRKCFVFDVLMNYLEHLSDKEEDEKETKRNKDSKESRKNEIVQTKHATRNFRKALEFGIGIQMFQFSAEADYLENYSVLTVVLFI